MSARAVYSIRIFATGGLTAAAGVVGPVVPAGLVYVVRDIDVTELTGVAGAIMIVKSQVLGQLWASQRNSAQPLGIDSWRGRQVYNTGEQVAFQAFSGTWAIACSGYQLTLP